MLYTVSKEKRVSPFFVAVRLLLDVLQLWLLIVQPQNGYDISSHTLLWRIVSFLGLNQFYSTRGYTFFLGSLYIMIVLLVFVLGLCVWVGQAFKENRFSYVWPIQVRHELFAHVSGSRDGGRLPCPRSWFALLVSLEQCGVR